jgi:hypothetical protein
MLTRRRLLLVVGAVVGVSLGALGLVQGARVLEPLPTRLTDREFWQISTDLSEPDGTFRSDNLLSNERFLQHVIPTLTKTAKKSGIYLGVGPEQNFTYMAALQPRMAFIVDIRRGNLHLHLMYKALFELSANRAEFVSRLFAKPRPASLTANSSAVELMDTYWEIATSDEAAYTANLNAILNHLTKTRALPLDAEDREGVSRSYRAFYVYGPAMDYSATTALTPLNGGRAATYRDLMKQTDASGKGLTYLASEESFNLIKDMFARNMIVPLVGNFSGPKTIRAVGDWVRGRGATINAFYVSTVEPYLRRAGTQADFCASVATLPMTEASVFIRPGNGLANAPSGIIPATRIGSYQTGEVVPMIGGCYAPATSSWRPTVRSAPFAIR